MAEPKKGSPAWIAQRCRAVMQDNSGDREKFDD